MVNRSQLMVLTVGALILLAVVVSIVLRTELRCEGFAGPGVTAEDLPPPLEHDRRLRLVAWNLRNFPLDGRPQDANLGFSRLTNICDLQDVLGGLDADLLALSEVGDTRRFPPLMRRSGGDRAYREIHSQRGGMGDQYLTLVWDSSRLEKAGKHWEIDELSFGGRLRPALAARFESRAADGVDFTAVAVHLDAGPDSYDSRFEQYRILARWVESHVREVGDDDVVVLGDFNSCGSFDLSSAEELVLMDELFATAGLRRHRNLSGCSEYWEGPGPRDGIQIPGLLDLVYLRGMSEADSSDGVRSWLHCARHRCEELVSREGAEDGTFWDVSDHCPITFEIDDRDADQP